MPKAATVTTSAPRQAPALPEVPEAPKTDRDLPTDVSDGEPDVLSGVNHRATDEAWTEILRHKTMATLPVGTNVWWIDREGRVKAGMVLAPAVPPAQTLTVKPDDGDQAQQVAAGDVFDNVVDAKAERNGRLTRRS